MYTNSKRTELERALDTALNVALKPDQPGVSSSIHLEVIQIYKQNGRSPVVLGF